MTADSAVPDSACTDCATLAGSSEPWCEIVPLPSSDRAEDWTEWTTVLAGFVDGAAHSIWFDSDLSDGLIRISGGYDRLRLEIACDSSFSEADRASLAGRGLLSVARNPDLAVVTEPTTGEAIRSVVVHEETWVWTGRGNELGSAMQTVYWGLIGPMGLNPSDELLVQVVQRDRSCQRCWEIVAHEFPY